MSNAPAKIVVAAFDFDGTITYRDTLGPFLLYLAGPFGVLVNGLLLLPVLVAYVLHLMPNSVAKERVLRRFLGGKSSAELETVARRFVGERLTALVRPQALARLAWHRAQGHRCIVVSASIDDYVGPWALAAGFDDVIATQLARDGNGRLSGGYDGANCYGFEKARRLQALLGDGDYELYAYGDSRGDRELLALADHAFFRTMPGGEDVE